MIFLENGEEAVYCEYGENQYRVKCGGNDFFENSDLFAIPEAGVYDIDQKTKNPYLSRIQWQFSNGSFLYKWKHSW